MDLSFQFLVTTGNSGSKVQPIKSKDALIYSKNFQAGLSELLKQYPMSKDPKFLSIFLAVFLKRCSWVLTNGGSDEWMVKFV